MPTYTYDLSTAVGQSRYFASDTDVSNSGAKAYFSDEEYTFLLSRSAGVPELAAAGALRAAAADNAKIATVTKRGQYGNDETEVYQALLRVAEDLEKRAPMPSSVGISSGYPVPVFTMDGADGTVGTMETW